MDAHEKLRTFDFCRKCSLVWVDANESDFIHVSVPKQTEKPQMSQEDFEALAFVEAQKLIAEERRENPSLYEDWRTIPGLLGLPTEVEVPGTPTIAWATWITSFAIVLVSLFCFQNQSFIEEFALIPNQVGRYLGLTLLTSFFVHANSWHLIANVYFLVLFGRAVERDLGPARWLLLLLAATLAGDALDILVDPRGDMPLIGASGGISGILAYYIFKYPTAQLAIMIRAIWVDLPAPIYFCIWIALQLLGAWQQAHGEGDVASLAHLGGVAAGIAFWLIERSSSESTLAPPDGKDGHAQD